MQHKIHIGIQAYDMHAGWRERDGRDILAKAKRNGGAITPYARGLGHRSFVVSWLGRDESGELTGCEGNLYVVRMFAVKEK